MRHELRILGLEGAETIHASPRSVVFRTRATEGRPRAVVEVLVGELGRPPSRERLARFRRTLETLGAQRSPHLLGVDRVEAVDGTLMAVFDDFAGRPVGVSNLHEPRLVEEALRVGVGVCRALAALHAAGLVHRDLRPSSVLWDRAAGEARLVNFGLASRQERVAIGPRAPRVLEGTLEYLSPEQTGRMNRPVDERSDLYSLGVTLYELLTGRVPFAGDDPLEILHGHLAKLPEAPALLVPELPLAVSDLVLRLLQKNAEDRYQTAEGVEADLVTCVERLASPSEAARPFLLATRDLPGRFRLPARLYGREAEVELLVGSFQGVAAGGVAFTLVSGRSGVGKSVLVQELYRPLAIARGRYVSGKYDQYQRSVPYSALAAALGSLCDQLLCESPDVLDGWRQRILGAVGRHGQVLIEVIPALERILGPQPALPVRDAQAARSLFDRVCQDFVQAICSADEPLVVFLDDLQWADLASLALLRTVLDHEHLRGLHLVGACRDNEVDASHPLLLLLDEVEKGGVAITRIDLANLSLVHVTDLVADTFSVDAAGALGLARIVYARTEGNAFFTSELVKALHADGLVVFDRARLRWTWDDAAILDRGITDNVVELMASRIRLLPEATQRLLRLGACIGGVFDTTTLAIISDGLGEVARVVGSLAPATELGVLVELDDVALATSGRYRFLHDRVQQAAWSLIPEDERRRVHLEIARLLIADVALHGGADDRLFEIVGHLRQGETLLTDREERLRAASLHLDAGRKARRASAHHAALDHLRVARRLLPDGAFDTHHELAFEVKLALAKSCAMAGERAEADALYPLLLARARTVMERVRVLAVQMDDHHLRGDYERAIDLQTQALAWLGERVPSDPAALAARIDEELELTGHHLGGRAIPELADAPEVGSAEVVAALETLVSLWMSAYLVSREDLVQWSSVRLTNLSLLHGNSPLAAFGYVQFAYLCVGRLQRFDDGYAYGQVALALADRYDNVEMRGKIYFLFGIFVSHWTRHVSLATEAMRKGYLFSVEAGDWTYAVYAAANVVSNSIIAGVHCDEVDVEAQQYLKFLRDKAPVGLGSFFLPGGYCALLNLQGRTRGPDTFDCEHLDERTFHDTFGHLPIVLAWFYAVKIRSLYLHRCFDLGVDLIGKAEVVAAGVPVQVKVPEAYFYSCLMLAATHHLLGDAEARAAAWGRFAEYEERLKVWAERCPDNHLHKYCLVVAERTRVEGGPLEVALGWYDRAVEAAQAARFHNVAAVARELKGRYWLARGNQAYAALELREAHHGFLVWGATTKVAMLEEEFPHLTGQVAPSAENSAAQLDLLSAHKGSRAISGKLELDELVQTMMGIVMESAGADRGVLLRIRGGRWRVEADAVLGQQVTLRPGEDDEAGPAGAPFSVVHYVVRTREPVTLDEPAHDLRFGQDPYVQAVQPRSILCVPLAHQGRTVGVLYLENKIGRGAFGGDRRELLEVLTGQMAISLDNASLFADLKATVASQGATLAELLGQRARLAEQASELRALNADVVSSNAELEAFSYSVAHDLRAPLRGMGGFARVLLDDYAGRLDEEGVDCLHEIVGNVQKMSSLIDALLSFSRLTRSELRPQRVDLSRLARSVARELAAADPEPEVELVVAEGLEAEVDPRLARVLLQNLMANAWKFTRRSVAPRVEVGATEVDGARAFFVRDNGAGFDMTYADKLFAPFQRLHTVADYPGTGIGLATVQRIVHRHGGRCWAEGRIGGGATFSFTLSGAREVAT